MKSKTLNLDWPITGITVVQNENCDLVLLADQVGRNEAKDKSDTIPILIQNVASSALKRLQIQATCSEGAILDQLDLHFENINPGDTIKTYLAYKPKKVQLRDKKIEIGDTIRIEGRLALAEESVGLEKTNTFIRLWDKQGCILNGYATQRRTYEEGKFEANIARKELNWQLRSIRLTFQTELRIDLILNYNKFGKEECSKKTIVTTSYVEDTYPTFEELKFNIDQLQMEIWEMKDTEDEYKWEWSMVPIIRKQRERPSSVITNCEICNKYVGFGKKRFKQCAYCGRWIGTKCKSCWDSDNFMKQTYCTVCADIHRRSLETLRQAEPKS